MFGSLFVSKERNFVAHVAVTEIISGIKEKLSPRYADPTLCQQTAWWMLEAVTKIDKAHLIARETIELTYEQEHAVDNWIFQQVHQHIPLQYLLGSTPFDDLEILVEPPTLIPRPETEEWTMHIIHLLKKIEDQKLTILDLCSGSGCIGLSIAHAYPKSHVYAADISPQAISLGKKKCRA